MPITGGMDICTVKLMERKVDRKKSEKESCSVMSDSSRHYGQSMEFSRPEYQTGQPSPSPGDLRDLGIEPRSPASWANSLPAEPRGKPKNIGVGSISLLQLIFPAQESNLVIHSSTTAWKIPWTEEPGRLQSMGLQRVGHD